ncbi:MAG: D-alanyl-D-alanine carboxypeptidase [Salaquimonas sp.]|nr:D-alanyl-D-alanine carboxypeptidase [Salaquimonas sp.]
MAAASVTFAFAQNPLYATSAKEALLVDADTGTVLFAKDENKPFPPASLAKLMTMEVVFHALKIGQLKLTDTFHISENAWRNGGALSGGSTMFAELNSDIPLDDLIHGVIIQSANDACIAIAEGMAGSEIAFAGLMNERARELGLNDSHFTNSTGLPDPLQHVTTLDLAKLATHIIREYPEYFSIYSQTEFTWNKIKQQNRNPLLKMSIGADGMKTGYTEESGYAIVGTVKRNNQRLIAVLSGMSSQRERAEEARKLLDWGSRAFEKLRLFEGGEVIGQASVFGGETSGVDVTGDGPVDIYLPIGFRDKLRARITYTGPLLPPVEKGDKVATLKVWIGDKLSQETPLFAAESVKQGGITRRAIDGAKELLIGWIHF